MLKFILISNFLFLIGIYGLFFIKRHIIVLLLSIELIFLSVNYNFLIFSIYLDDFIGQFYVLCVISIAAAELAIGLAILIIFFRLRGGISVDLISLLKG